MKSFLLLLIAFFTTISAALCQEAFSIRANMNTGIAVQKNKFPTAFGIGGTYEASWKKIKPLKFTAGMDIQINGIKNMPYELNFGSSVTNTKVHYTSYVVQALSGFKYIAQENKQWSPYIGLSGGVMAYYTEMSIEDPHDSDGCSPMETKPVSTSFILAAKPEAGVRVKMKSKCQGSDIRIEAGGGYVAGTRGKYLRLNNQQQHHNHAEDDYMVKFKHNTSGQVHEHSLGTLYKTATSQLAFHVAVVFDL